MRHHGIIHLLWASQLVLYIGKIQGAKIVFVRRAILKANGKLAENANSAAASSAGPASSDGNSIRALIQVGCYALCYALYLVALNNIPGNKS